MSQLIDHIKIECYIIQQMFVFIIKHRHLCEYNKSVMTTEVVDMRYSIYALGIMTAVVSFLGFVVENVWLAFTKGYIDNRNMNAPFLVGYGMLILFMYFVLGTPGELLILKKLKRDVPKWAGVLIYFILSFFVVCIAEVALGVIFEKVSGIQYWNYSMIPMHFTQYTSVPTSVGFALLITIFMGAIFTPLMELSMRMDPRIMKWVSIVLVVIMLGDLIINFYHMITSREFVRKWRIYIKRKSILRRIY